jgi:hypothetical protein
VKIIEDAISKAGASGAYIAAQAKLQTLEEDLKQAKREVEARAKAPKSSMVDMVQAVLSGVDMADNGMGDTEPIDRARQRVRVIGLAIEEQRRRVRDARRALAEEIGPSLRPHHQRIVGRMAKALKELSDATAEEEALRYELDRRELGFPGMHPLGFTSAVRLDMPHSEALNWLGEAKEHGYV